MALSFVASCGARSRVLAGVGSRQGIATGMGSPGCHIREGVGDGVGGGVDGIHGSVVALIAPLFWLETGAALG